MTATTANPATGAAGATLHDVCSTLFAAERLPGVAVAVVRREQPVQTAFLGSADVERGWPIDERTVFRIGSVGKTMTAIAVMQLVEAGRVSLDDPVGRHVRDIPITPPPGSREVTVRDLLTHTSGIGLVRRPTDLLRPLTGLAAAIGKVPEPRDYYRGGIGAGTPPGSRWSYANHGFTILGQLVSDVSGLPYHEYMARRVFEPLGMTHTAVRLTPDLRGHLAIGYRVRRGRLSRVRYRDVIVEPAGSIFADVSDMIRYTQALLGGGANATGRVIGADTLSLMTRRHFTCDERLPSGFGLGFMVDEAAGHRTFWHSGGWPGFSTMLQVFPEAGVGVLVFVNAMVPARALTIAEAVSRHALGEPAEPPRPAAATVAEPVAAAIAGTYAPLDRLVESPLRWVATGVGGGFVISRSDSGLVMRTRIPIPKRKTTPLVPSSAGDPFLFEAGDGAERRRLAFQVDAGGAVTGVCVEGLFSLRKLA